jgi:hypothetical protein
MYQIQTGVLVLSICDIMEGELQMFSLLLDINHDRDIVTYYKCLYGIKKNPRF